MPSVSFPRRVPLRALLGSTLRITVETSPATAALRGPAVVVANHASHLDAALILTTLPAGLRKVKVGAASDYFFTTRWRAALVTRFFAAFPVDRDGSGANRGVAAALLADGYTVVLFPEGTRSRDGTLGTFQPGAAALCVSQGMACVPVRISGAYDAMPRGTRWPRKGRPPVTVRYGAPLWPAPDSAAHAFGGQLREAVRILGEPGPAGRLRPKVAT